MAQDNLKKSIELRKLAKSLPGKPGCYLFYSEESEIIYVGKAKNLKNRVSSYFNSDHKNSPKTRYMVEKIRNIKFELVETDAEAFVLENFLIKKHRPKYNIRLKDDKSYPYVLVDFSHEFPLLEFRRKVKRDKNIKSFGPFVQGSNIYNILKEVIKAFELRDCSNYEFRSRKTACILYQMSQCSGSCVGLIDQKKYLDDLDHALNIFKGRGDKSIKFLKAKMMNLSGQEKYEQASMVRDSLEVLKDFVDNFQMVVSKESQKDFNLDIVSYYFSKTEIDISISIIRNGVNFGHKSFYFFKGDLMDGNQSFEESLYQFYVQYLFSSKDELPRSVFFDLETKNDLSELDTFFEKSVKESFNVKMKVLKSSDRFKKIIGLNKLQAEENHKARTQYQSSMLLALEKLKSLLNLKEPPRHIECYDVAIFQGKSPTASQVVFMDGEPDKKLYRHYHLEERLEGNNDFAMMKEVASRRVKKGRLPDLIIVDGGKGQVSSFSKGFGDNQGTVIIGIAKSKTDSKFTSNKIDHSDERLVIPNKKDSVKLQKGSALYRLVTQMRDEAHRFSRNLHHRKEESKLEKSWLDDVKGIGPKTKQKILQKLDVSKSVLRELSHEEISEKFQLSPTLSKRILEILNK